MYLSKRNSNLKKSAAGNLFLLPNTSDFSNKNPTSKTRTRKMTIKRTKTPTSHKIFNIF